jgi:Protein of unknown function (DUF2591)
MTTTSVTSSTEMVKVLTENLIREGLDWAVAKCEGALHPVGNVRLVDLRPTLCVGNDPDYGGSRVVYEPSTDWAQGGPIMFRENIAQGKCRNNVTYAAWKGYASDFGMVKFHTASTPLCAAMKCFVASRMGNEIEMPVELYEAMLRSDPANDLHDEQDPVVQPAPRG